MFIHLRLLLSLSLLVFLSGCSEDPGLEGAPCPCDEEGGFICVEGTCRHGGDLPLEEEVCEAGSWHDDGDITTPCTAWSVCTPGQFVATEGTASSDRRCESCPQGTFSEGTNADSCRGWTSCVPGEFVAVEGDATSDRDCQACGQGTYSVMVDSVTCQPHDACAAGTVETSPATSSSDPVCQPCAAGSFCAGGDAPEEACRAGTWDHDQNPASPCQPCGAGSYAGSPGALSCLPWTDCQPGEFVATEGSATGDRVCTACAPPSTTTSVNATTCVVLDACAQALGVLCDEFEQVYLKASNTGSNDRFGHSLALSGDTLAVGAHLEASSATGVNGNQSDNSAFGSGAVYVFVRSIGVWSQQAYLKASNTGSGDWFGHSAVCNAEKVIHPTPKE